MLFICFNDFAHIAKWRDLTPFRIYLFVLFFGSNIGNVIALECVLVRKAITELYELQTKIKSISIGVFEKNTNKEHTSIYYTN